MGRIGLDPNKASVKSVGLKGIALKCATIFFDLPRLSYELGFSRKLTVFKCKSTISQKPIFWTLHGEIVFQSLSLFFPINSFSVGCVKMRM